jgi:aminocarboxymuconate-semialdehyde decarboxylase
MTYPYQPEEKWDVHTHTTLSPNTFEALARFSHYADFIRVRAHDVRPCYAELVNSQGIVQRVIEHHAYDPSARLVDCDRHRVTMQVLSPTPMMIPDYVDDPDDAAEICRILNDANADIVSRFPDRFVALAAVPMMFPERAIEELERIRQIPGMRGIEINSNVHGHDLDDPRFFPVFEAAARLGLAVFVHPWGGFMSPAEERLRRRMNAGRNWRPWLLGMGLETALAFDSLRCGGVHERLPNLRVLYAHGGGMFPALLGRLEHGAYCRPDLFTDASKLNPYRTIKECAVYADTLTHDPWMLHMLVQTLGPHRIAMGSDYPYPLGEIDPFETKGIYPGSMVEHLPASERDMEAAWEHFHWLGFDSDDSHRTLPLLSNAHKERLLSGTAKEWLGFS